MSAKEYKKKMEQEKEDKVELEQKNRERAYEVMCQQEHSR